MRRAFFCLMLFLLLFPCQIYGTEDSYLQELEVIDEATEDYLEGTSFTALMESISSGEMSFSMDELREKLGEMAFGEVRTQSKLILQLLMVTILAAVLRQLTGSFAGKEVGELGFYVCYMILIAVILQTFFQITEAVVLRMEQCTDAFYVMLPVFLAFAASSGNLTQTALMGPTMMGGCTLIATVMRTIVVPVVLVAVALEMTDKLSEKPMTARFAKLLRQCLSWGLKGLACGFMLLLSIQKLGGGAINSLTVRTAKIAVNAVPIVGDVMGGAVDTAAAVSGTLRHSTLAAVILFFVLFCLPLILKLVVMTLIFKFTAAAAESICETRLVDCIGIAGDYTALLLGAVFLVQVMLLFAAVLLLGVL